MDGEISSYVPQFGAIHAVVYLLCTASFAVGYRVYVRNPVRYTHLWLPLVIQV